MEEDLVGRVIAAALGAGGTAAVLAAAVVTLWRRLVAQRTELWAEIHDKDKQIQEHRNWLQAIANKALGGSSDGE